MLPPPCRWIDWPDASRLYWHYGCIAVVQPDGRLTIRWWSQVEGRAASREQDKRHVERWVAKRKGLPPGGRAVAVRGRSLHKSCTGSIPESPDVPLTR